MGRLCGFSANTVNAGLGAPLLWPSIMQHTGRSSGGWKPSAVHTFGVSNYAALLYSATVLPSTSEQCNLPSMHDGVKSVNPHSELHANEKPCLHL